MKILLILEDATNEEAFYNAFDPIAERNELQVCRSVQEADCFIAKELILNQKELDVIVTDLFEDEKRSAREFCYDIRNDYSNTFSNRSFKLSSLPILLMFPGRINHEQYINFGFDAVVDSSYDWFYDNLLNSAINLVKKWRNFVYDDLELLKVGKKEIFNKYDLSIQISKCEVTKILTSDYVRRQLKLEVPWFQPNYNFLEKGLELMTKGIRASEKTTRKNEKLFHKVLNKYDPLLLRGNYSHHFYEPRFVQTDKYQESIPDFVLTPYYGESKIDVMEFKTPNEPFYEQSHFHTTLRKRMFKHIGQVKDYKDYIEDPENERILENQLGLKPITVSYSLVVGRDDDFWSKYSVYKKRARQFSLEEIRIMTFDHFVDLGEHYFNEMQMLGV